MAAKSLSNDDLALGRAVLLATDSLGMSVEGAFWLYEDEEDNWNYFLITSLFNRMGPRSIYLKLNKALSEVLSEREIDSFTFYIADPHEEVANMVRKQISTSSHSSAPQRKEIGVLGQKTQSFVYRMSGSLNEDEAKSAQRRFSRRVSQFVAA